MSENNSAPAAAQAAAKKPKRQPERKIGPFAAGIGATVWLNTVQTENGSRTLRSITINPRRYFDRESNEWKDAPSYNPADLPALIFSLQKAQEYCYEEPLPDQPVGSAEQSNLPSGDEIPF